MELRSRRFATQFAFSLAFMLVILGHVGGIYRLPFVPNFEAALYDLKVNLFRAQGVDDRVVVVDIDEKSLLEIGRWPWPREQTAAMTRQLLEEYGVAAVGYDIVFAEPDESSGLQVMQKLARGPLAEEEGFKRILQQIGPALDYDGKLAEALTSGPTVLGYYFYTEAEGQLGEVGALPKPLFPCSTLHELGVRPSKGAGYGANLPRLQASTEYGGFFNMQPDFDGVARRMPVIVDYQGQCYGSLAFNLLRAGMGADSFTLHPPGVFGPGRISPASIEFNGLSIPLDEQGMALVPYRQPAAFPYISAADVIKGRVPASHLEGRLVLIGSSAPGIMDLRVTPTAKIFPGVEIHANMVSGILDHTTKWEPPGIETWHYWATAIIGFALAMILPLVTPVIAAVISVSLIVLHVGMDAWLWYSQHMSLSSVLPIITVSGLFVLNMSYGFFVEARSKLQITRLFGQYVPPELVEEMARDPARYSLRGESREMTVMFSDIRDFTSISEGLDATALADMLNAYLSAMTQVIQEHKGTVDKYIGDAIMAFWGAPMSDDFHARDGVLTALAMQKVLHELNPQLEANGWPAVKIGVGVNTGRMSVGNMGSSFRMAYTVMADAVNLASRLEGLTKQYGVGVLCGEATQAACPEILFRPVDRVRVKGKQVPVAIYEPLGPLSEVDADVHAAARSFETALDAYQAKRWDEAEATLKLLQGKAPCKLYEIYLERIAHFRNNPPPEDWDGVFTFTTK